MRALNRQRIVRLNAVELNRMARWFAAAYDAGWRPADWAPEADGALRGKLAQLEEEQRVADGDVPWV